MKSKSLIRLLIVEDVPEDSELIILTLMTAGIQIQYDIASSASTFKENLHNKIYDGVFSDYRLPGTNGLQLFEILKESGQDIPFILITGSLGEEAAVECIRTGMTDYVLKDRLFRLPTVLQRALDEFELRRQQKLSILEIQQQAWQEATANQILQAMRETLVLEEILQTTVEELLKALNVSFCLIYQRGKNQDFRLSFASNFEFNDSNFTKKTSIFEPYFQPNLIQGEQIIYDEGESYLHPDIQQICDSYSIRSFLITPLIYRKAYLGKIGVYQCDRPRTWTANEKSVAKVIADHCVIAIHQADLYQKAQSELVERKKMEDKLRYDSLHDALTNLPNRTLILDRLNHALQHFHRQKYNPLQQALSHFAVLFLDLDRFKLVNDSLGHAAGDQLLKIVAQRLLASLRAEDSLARLGGDEFVILLENIHETSDVIEIVHRIQKNLELPMLLENHEVCVASSIGIVMSDSQYTHPDQLLRDADTAMYRSKTKHRGSYQIFDQSMHTQVMNQLQIENQLRHAIEHQELTLHYQPIVCLETFRIKGFEALIRWQHPKRGLISPSEFIPIAEDTGLIVPLDLWVLKTACAQLQKWEKFWSKNQDFSMSVNISAQHFSQKVLVEDFDKILKIFDINPNLIKIEITESTLIEKTNVASAVLSQLKQRKSKISLDDFGTGYSSLSYLHRFPIDTLKIDRSFISQIESESENNEIVEAIINLGLNLDLEIIAEGIENSLQLEFLRKHNCHAGQGYYFAKPLDSQDASYLFQNASCLLAAA